MNKILLFFILVTVIIIGFFGFWYLRSLTFSAQILSVKITAPATVAAGSQIIYVVTYKNNSNYLLQNPMLTFQLPDNSLTEDGKTIVIQNLNNIQPGAGGTAQFTARLLGKQQDAEVATAALSYMPQNLSARYETDASVTTTISDVPVDVTFVLPPNVSQGQDITWTINYLSNIDYPLENLSIKVDPVSGFNLESANPSSLDNVEWKLATLQEGQGGTITINGTIAQDAPDEMTFVAHLGMWQDGTFVVIKDISQNVTVNPGLQSDSGSNSLVLAQKAYHVSKAGWQNYGPIPPAVNQTTTYTVTWQVENYGNNLENVNVSAPLPQGVSFTAKVSPASQASNIYLDSASGQVVWLVGNLLNGAGVTGIAPSVSFQLALTPSAVQEGHVAQIIGRAVVSGQDAASRVTISNGAPAVTTDLPDDVSNSGGGVVGQ